MFDLASCLRTLVSAIVFAGIEYRYVNRREAQWTKEKEGFYESSLLSKYTPYHVFFLLPLFLAISYTGSITAWAGNVFLAALVEDLAYFAWRKKMVVPGEWTTQLFGSVRVGNTAIPVWWPLDLLIVLLMYSVTLA